ncbi:hypothetical protein E2F46_05570 [Luteimonas aestuarii]|uniref:Uncharacterized protein n=1 Tax=Luteimonas aestuarii TaxID=453837 RepID=A0A4R5TXZ3_9GAMM|nr:hypothetical protein [Luteimonas aestuarii]TDK26068.1 hypothetical protein E2F46_05570 [Luteimonas aestuarii]
MAQALRDAEGRELHLADGYSLDDGVLSVEGAPLFLFDDPGRLDPDLLDAIASSMPGARVARR